MNKLIAFSSVFVIGVIFALGFTMLSVSPAEPEQKRDVLLNELSSSIDKANDEGRCISTNGQACALKEVFE